MAPARGHGRGGRSWRRRRAASACARRRRRSGADLVFLDLEDACAPAAKESARKIAIGALDTSSTGDARSAPCGSTGSRRCGATTTSSRSSPARASALDVLIVPKARTARDVWWVDVLLTQLEAKLGLDEAHRPRGAHRGRGRSGQRRRDRAGERSSRSDDLRSRRPLGVAARARRRQLRPDRASTRATSGTSPAPRSSPRRVSRASTRSTRPYPAYKDPDGLPASCGARQPARASTASGRSIRARSRSPTRCSRRPPRRSTRRGGRSRSTAPPRRKAWARSALTAGSSTLRTCAWRTTCCSRPIWRTSRRVERVDGGQVTTPSTLSWTMRSQS